MFFFLLSFLFLPPNNFSQAFAQQKLSASPTLSRSSTQNLSVIAYYPMWSVCDIPPQKLDFKAFSHLIWFWGEPSATYPYFNLVAGSNDSTTLVTGTPGWCKNPLDNGSNGLTHLKIMRDSCRANGVKLLLCVGGEVGSPASNFAAMVADTVKQDAFIQAATGFAQRNGFDGIDIDWEFPSRGASARALYSRFLTKLRTVLDSWTQRGVLTTALPTWYWWDWAKTDPLIDKATMNACFDFVDLMQYGMQNTSRISHYAPLYHNPNVNQETMTDRGVLEYKGAGIDSGKIVILIPFECLKMTGSSSPISIGQTGGGNQWIGFRDIPATATVHWDDVAKANWAESGTAFYSYENQVSIGLKVQFARDQHIGGVGVWELWRGWLPSALPGQQDPLLQLLKAAVGGITPPPSDHTPKIKGELYFDKNSNGMRDTGEPSIPGWRIQLSGAKALSMLTDSSGSYSFEDLPHGAYTVSEVQRSPWTQTSPSQPSSYSVTINSDTIVNGKDFGNYASTVSGYSVPQGWNLISLPLIVNDNRPSSLYPTSTSNAIGYNGSYFPEESLKHGIGYWLKFPYAQTLWLAGTPFSLDTISVTGGWNIIGSISYPVAANAVSTIPFGILSSFIFGYRRGNIITDTIQPGGGYWVQTSGPGKIILLHGSVAMHLEGENAANLDKMSSLRFSTSEGDDQKIYFTSDQKQQTQKSFYQLPPPAPESVFDVRFMPQSTNNFGSLAAIIDNLGDAPQSFPISIRSASYPLKVRWNILDGSTQYRLESSTGDSYLLNGTGEVTISKGPMDPQTSTATFVLKASVPISYKLEQNYPNPFNNSTVIGFSLPSESHVRLVIYNILGAKVVSLVDRSMKEGKYSIPFDASKLASGVYFYKLDAVSSMGKVFTSVHRMVLLK
ncbi:MAG: T9SS type A sorting domain-containing protein [Ignavibacteria bacterium]|nr:T9SS type A sorting domain-containing protein [Ignavibacteria bacterium]